jgi:RHS repeat-associated protein
MKSLNRVLVLLAVVLSAVLLPAQVADEPIYAPVKFKVTASVTTFYLSERGGPRFGYNNGSVTATLNGASASDSGRKATLNTPIQTSFLEVGKPYSLVISTGATSNKTVYITPSPGYLFTVDGTAKNSFSFSGGTGVYTVRIIPAESQVPRPAGTASSITGGQIKWNVALGSLLNGESAGALSIVGAAIDDWSPFFTPTTLYYDSLANDDEVRVHREGGNIRQVSTKEAFVDVVTLNGASYEIRFYSPASATGTNYPKPLTGRPFVTYRISQDSLTKLRLTKETRTVLSPTDTTAPIARSETTTIERTGTSPAFTWTVADWTLTGQTALSREVRTWTGNASGGHDETIQILDPSNTVAAQSFRSHTKYFWGDTPTQATIGTTAAVTTHTVYNTDPANPSSFGFTRSVQSTGGAWSALDYFPTTDDLKLGTVSTTYGPYLNSPASISMVAGTGVVTSMTYAADPFGMLRRLATSESRINGTLVAKTSVAYAQSIVNGMYVVSATRQDQSNSAGSTLTSTTLTYQEDTGDAFFRNQAHAIIKPDRSAQSFIRQRGTWDGTTFTPAATPGTLAPASRHGTISGVADNTAGTQLVSTYGTYVIQPLYLVPNKSTLDFVIRNNFALTARTESYVWDGAGWNLISWTNFTYNNNNQLTNRVTSTGDTYDATYVGELKQWERDGTGIKATYGYDNASRVITVTKEGVSPQVDLVSATSYDAANRVLTQSAYAATAPTGEKLTTSRTYDLAGRPVTETAPGTGATTYSYDPVNRSQTVTTPDLATRTQTTYLDGQAYSTTGTGTVAQYITYGFETDGRRYSQINLATANSARWSKTWTDWLGRSDRSERPGFTGQANFVEQNTYHATTGQLTKTDRTGTASTLYTYNALGQPVLSGLDINANGVLDLASADRITGQDKFFANENGAWWLASRSYTYPTLNSATEITLASTRERLTGFSGNLRSEARSTDAEGNTAIATVSVDRTARTVTKSTQAPGLSAAQVETSINGLGTTAASPDGITVTTGYDLLQRPVTSTNIRAGVTRTVTTVYEANTARPSTVTDPTGTITATYGYDTMGRKTSVKNVDNNYTRTAYTLRGEVLAQWGEATSPVSFGYSDFGERTSLTTYRTDTGWTGTTWPAAPAAGDTTTYTFDGPSGLLIKKTDAASRYVEYTYNSRGQVLNRYWSRTLDGTVNTSRVTATYGYDAYTAEPTGITYNDGTPSVTTTYTRSAQVSTVSDFTGTRSFTYDSASPWRLSTDTLPAFYQNSVFTRLYETTTDNTLGTVKGRARGFQLGASANSASLLQQTYAWNALGRVASVTAGTNNNASSQVFSYNYLAGSRLIESLVATGTAFTTTRSYDNQRDLLTSIKGQYSTATKSQFDYTFDAFGRRATAAQSGEAFNDYGAATVQRFNYNDRGELTAATGYLGSEAAANKLPGRQFEFGYDAAGNRTSGNHTGDSTKADTFVPNQLNQLTSRQNKALSVSGTAAADATVVADDQATVRKGGFWQLELLQPETAQALARSFVIIAAKSGSGNGSADLAQIDRRWLFQPGYTETLDYDTDGNLTSDAKWTYSWDAENRLTAMEAKPWTALAGAPARQRLEFRYDSTGRRVQKRALTEIPTTPGTWNLATETRFLYDGWNLIAEFEATSSQLPALSLKRSFAWGLDLTGSFTAAGGIGALLQITDATTGTRYLPTYDGNGNVATLVNATTGGLGASYEYNAFGEPLRANGAYAKTNPIRFSTKYTDNETGLIYYGKRYYDARNGRFINRDPIEERGGMNLYGFCGNDGVNQWDYLGNFSLKKLFKSKVFQIAAVVALSALTYGAMSTVAASMVGSGGLGLTGVSASIAAGAIQGAAAGFVGGVAGAAMSGASLGQSLTAGAWGALSGAVAGGIGGAFGKVGNFNVGMELGRAATHGVTQGGISSLRGGDFGAGAAAGFFSSFAGSGLQAAGAPWQVGMPASGLIGGVSSRIGGGNFEDGFMSGFAVGAYNHWGHDISTAAKRGWSVMKDTYKKIASGGYEFNISRTDPTFSFGLFGVNAEIESKLVFDYNRMIEKGGVHYNCNVYNEATMVKLSYGVGALNLYNSSGYYINGDSYYGGARYSNSITVNRSFLTGGEIGVSRGSASSSLNLNSDGLSVDVLKLSTIWGGFKVTADPKSD